MVLKGPMGGNKNLSGIPGEQCHGISHSTSGHVQDYVSDHKTQQYSHQHTLCMEMHKDDQQQL